MGGVFFLLWEGSFLPSWLWAATELLAGCEEWVESSVGGGWSLLAVLIE